MTKLRRTDRAVRIAGFLVGVALASLALMGWTIPSSSSQSVGTDLRMVAIAGGELNASKPGVFLEAVNLLPGGTARAEKGTVVIANQGDEEVSVRMRARPTIRDLDRLLRVRLRVERDGLDDTDQRVFRGTLGELRRWTAQPFTLGEGEKRALEARVWLPQSARNGYQGLSVDVTLELEAEHAGRAPAGSESGAVR
jgi:hypothetical protein